MTEIEEIMNYFNHVMHSKHTCRNKNTRSLVNARLDEGFTVEDFKKVIDIKWSHWHDNEMRLYLRPRTLFSGKFEDYLNQERTPTLEEVFGEFADIPDEIKDIWK